MTSLQGKVAIVTGGSRGIGKAICLRLAHDGATVVVNYVANASAAEEVVKQIGSDRAIAVQGDAAKIPDIENLVQTTMKKFGRIDIVIASAGVMHLNELSQVSEAEFDNQFNINVKGPMFLVQV
jgi:3-oxoacyl-[acyl-carrier protein] reductase